MSGVHNLIATAERAVTLAEQFAAERDREISRGYFASVLFTGPLLQADVIVTLCGEDAKARVETANALFLSRGAPSILLSGGRHEPPSIESADAMKPLVMAKGIHFEKIHLETASQNTREQAQNVIALAQVNEWKRLLLVASAYHLPRAFLTFVRTMDDAKVEDVRIVGVPASHTPWFGSPDGMTETRLDLLAREYAKVDEYRAKGHVASYDRGLEYLKQWEGR